MKLNKKGYMLVEIIISFVLAMGIAYYLLNLTYKFKNMDEDIYRSSLFTKDKIVITKNIMNDLDRGIITGITPSSDNKQIDFKIQMNENNQEESRRLTIKDKTITYGKPLANGGFDTNDKSYYKKTIDDFLTIKTIDIDDSKSNYITIRIPIESIYDNENYDIKLFAQKG